MGGQREGASYSLWRWPWKELHAHLEREDLARDNPRDRAPSGGEEEDEDTDERDAGLLRGDIEHDDVAERVLGSGGGTEDSDDELRHGHADSAPE